MKNNPCSPLMGLLQYIYVPPVLGNSSPGGVSPVLSGDERSPPMASDNVLNKAQDNVDLLCDKGTYLAHNQLIIY